jgi:hypothetical protein
MGGQNEKKTGQYKAGLFGNSWKLMNNNPTQDK